MDRHQASYTEQGTYGLRRAPSRQETGRDNYQARRLDAPVYEEESFGRRLKNAGRELSNTAYTGAGYVARELEHGARALERDVEGAANYTEQEFKKGAHIVYDGANKFGRDVVREGRVVEEELERGARYAGQELKKGANFVRKEGEKVGEEFMRGARKVGGFFKKEFRELESAGGHALGVARDDLKRFDDTMSPRASEQRLLDDGPYTIAPQDTIVDAICTALHFVSLNASAVETLLRSQTARRYSISFNPEYPDELCNVQVANICDVDGMDIFLAKIQNCSSRINLVFQEFHLKQVLACINSDELPVLYDDDGRHCNWRQSQGTYFFPDESRFTGVDAQLIIPHGRTVCLLLTNSSEQAGTMTNTFRCAQNDEEGLLPPAHGQEKTFNRR